MKKKEGGVEGGGAKPFFIAPRISHRGSKHAPHASTQQDSTPPRAASSLRHHRGFGAVGGAAGSGKGWQGQGGGLALGFSPQLHSLIYLFIYIPAYYLIPPIFHGCHIPTSTAKIRRKICLIFFFFLAGTRFLVVFFLKKKKLPSLPPRNAAAVPVLPMFILGCLPAPVALMLAPHGFSKEPKAG